MVWKGRRLRNIAELMDDGIDACLSIEEAREFMKLYREHTPSADENIGYISGYYDVEDAKRIRRWFEVVHPIFGTTDPTSEDAFRMGLLIGQRMRREEDPS